jgi:hypothetical protein
MSHVDLFDAPQPPPQPPRRWLTLVVGVAGLLVGTPILAFAAVRGFAEGWRRGPQTLHGDNIVQPFVYVLAGVAGAFVYVLTAMVAMSLVGVAVFVIRHRRLGARRPPS